MEQGCRLAKLIVCQFFYSLAFFSVNKLFHCSNQTLIVETFGVFFISCFCQNRADIGRNYSFVTLIQFIDTALHLQILPGEVASAKDNPSAKQDLLSIQTETDKLKKDMKVLYEEKLAQFIKTEKKLLDAGLRQVGYISVIFH